MASKLPFVIAPRLQPVKELVGSDESGKIEIERRGYLTVAEKAFAQGAISSDDSIAMMHDLVNRIAKETKHSAEEVFADLSKVNKKYLDPYIEDISKASRAMVAYQEKYKLVVGTALLVSRVNPAWEVTDTMELHPDIIEGLVALYEDEERRSIEALVSANKTDEDVVEQAEGKE
jgi:hypothetical protein